MADTPLSSNPMLRENQQAAYIRHLEAVIARLEGWENESIWAWCRMRYEDDVLTLRVIAECEALRRGVGVTYAAGDDPVAKLKNHMPSMEQLDACEQVRLKHQPKDTRPADETTPQHTETK